MTCKLLLPLAAILALAGCGDPSSPTADDQTAAVPASDATPLPLNETGKAEGIEFTVTKIDTPTQIGPAGIGTAAGQDETYVVVSYTLKNTSAAPLSFLERPRIDLADGGGQTYAIDDLASGLSAATMEDPTGMSADLNPNVSAKAKVAWKVDKASFDPATWRLVVASDPRLTFALQ